MAMASSYAPATRHPWPCLVFLLPLLLAYETGVVFLGGPYPETIRNGADHWLRCALGYFGIRFFWVPPVLLVATFLYLTLRNWSNRPADLLNIVSGMVLESVTFALGLWALSRLLAPLLVQAGIDLNMGVTINKVPWLSVSDPALKQLITYIGAGIYEEAVFRLVLFSFLAAGLQKLDVSRIMAVLVAALGSAILFSTAHHIGPYGQTYSNYLFMFRLVAGLYFALLFELRGFGIAVGSHACYNIMVSVG